MQMNRNRTIKNVFLLSAILLLGLLLRLHHLDRYPFGYDEALSVLDARSISSFSPISEFFDSQVSLEQQAYHAIYERTVVYYWKKMFGDSEFVLRLTSVFFGMFGLYMMYALCRIIYDNRTGLLGLFLLAVSPFHIYYSQELRPYTATCFFTLFGLYCLFKIVKDRRKNFWIPYIFANIINIYFHYITLIIFLAETIFIVVSSRKRKGLFTEMVLAHSAILLFVSQAFFISIHYIAHALVHPLAPLLTEFPAWARNVSFQHILFTLKIFTIGYNVNFYSLAGFIMTVLFLVLFAIMLIKDNQRLRVIFTGVLLFFPLLFVFAISKFLVVCYVYRYFFPVFPLYLLGVSRGLLYCKKPVRTILAIIILFGTWQGVDGYYSSLLPDDASQHIGLMTKDTNVKELARFMTENYRSKDQIYFTTRFLVFPVKFYARSITEDSPSGLSEELVSETDEGKVLALTDRESLTCFSYNKTWPAFEVLQPFVSTDETIRTWVIDTGFDSRPRIIEKVQNIFVEKERYSFGPPKLFLFLRKEENEHL